MRSRTGSVPSQIRSRADFREGGSRVEGSHGGVRSEGGRSKYVQEERRVDQRDLNLAFNFKYRPLQNLKVTGGLNGKFNVTEYYKVLADLLGGQYFVDIDNFADRDFAAEPYMAQNDLDYYLSHNGQARILHKGDKYGYDYNVHVINAGGWVNGEYTIGNLDINLGARLGYTSFWREGLVRKGLFPGMTYTEKKCPY